MFLLLFFQFSREYLMQYAMLMCLPDIPTDGGVIQHRQFLKRERKITVYKLWNNRYFCSGKIHSIAITVSDFWSSLVRSSKALAVQGDCKLMAPEWNILWTNKSKLDKPQVLFLKDILRYPVESQKESRTQDSRNHWNGKRPVLIIWTLTVAYSAYMNCCFRSWQCLFSPPV